MPFSLLFLHFFNDDVGHSCHIILSVDLSLVSEANGIKLDLQLYSYLFCYSGNTQIRSFQLSSKGLTGFFTYYYFYSLSSPLRCHSTCPSTVVAILFNPLTLLTHTVLQLFKYRITTNSSSFPNI